MNLINVESSNIKQVGWLNDTMRVVFSSGRIYDYVKVPKHVFKYFLESESKGKFFNNKILNKFTFVRVDINNED